MNKPDDIIGRITFSKESMGQRFAVTWPAKLSGNGDKMTVCCEGDQFVHSELKRTAEGFELSVYGTWEIHAFLLAMAQAAEAHGLGDWWVKDKEDI